MDFLKGLIDIVLHLDVHLAKLTAEYGTSTILILSVIVFCETIIFISILPGLIEYWKERRTTEKEKAAA
jgi:membrane-associated protein